MTAETGLRLFARERKNRLGPARVVHQHDLLRLRRHKSLWGEPPWIAELGGLTDGRGKPRLVGTAGRINNRDRSLVLPPSMTWRENGDNLLGALDRLGIDHQCAGVHVAKVDHLGRPVRVGCPQMMVVDLGAVDVFPTLVEDPTVMKRPGRVVVFQVGGNGMDVFAIRPATMEDGHLRQTSN